MEKTANTRGAGCISFIFAFLLAAVLFGLSHRYVPINPWWLYGIYWYISLRLIHKLFYDKQTSKGSLFYIVLFLIFFIWIKGVFNSSPVRTTSEDDFIATKKIKIDNDSVAVFSHSRRWRDYYGHKYTGEFNIRIDDYYSSEKFHNAVQIKDKRIWNELYTKVAKEDEQKLDLILKELHFLYKAHQLNQREFAEMVVSFVQDIPYSLVFQGECMSPEVYDQSIREVLEECPDCCIGNKRFGIQTPVEFLSNLKGDCDTRTILIFTILKHFGYDVAILNSEFYLHSVIGIALPSTGAYKAYRGKRYYLWETTNKYYEIGQVPNHLSNTNHWFVVLTSKP